ncbi:DUF2808 domain-containing protein [Nostoc sp. UHCC 0870]|uniref:DUF2808 domain-containing protein n=1 Tax=Nostoc sp. UHCC 0870 TaxID=2914041 RepID=UPI001EE10B83|nr:DUF2808 domain-containing protein [Nostoc sp. UHCC 0870]UKP00641.1 DUF2808 domain-containing protein [Nostoc sp. UHCC 0870]
MRLAVVLGTAIATTVLICSQSQAIQLQDGTVYFAQPPRLVESTTTYNELYVWGATYYFTVSLPENAGEPLQKITINQRDGVDNIRFDLKNSIAFEGTRSRRGERIGLKDVTSDRKTRTVSLMFDLPISPGKTVTIGLKPWQNPTSAGVYLFGVTAFPQGEKTHSQFLGFGRLHFYNQKSNYFPSLYGW